MPHTPCVLVPLALRLRVVAVALGAAVAAPASAQWTTAPVTAPGVQYRTFSSAAAGTTVSFHIYLPPAYANEPNRRFPVLYWLHGSGDPLAGIPQVTSHFASGMARGLIPPMIVVIPNGMNYSMWCNSKPKVPGAGSGAVPMENVVLNDLVPHVDAIFRTIAQRSGRIVDGFSMGGAGSGRFGFRRPDLFAGVSMLGAGPLQLDFLDAPKDGSIPSGQRLAIYETVWGSDPAYYLEQHPRTVASNHAAEIIASAQRIRQVVGDQDFVLEMNQEFDAHLTGLGISHEFSVLPGVGHNTLGVFLGLGPGNAAFYRGLFDRYDPAGVDLNDDALINFFDLAVYADGFVGGDPAADLNADGIINFFYLAEYLSRYRGSCL